MDGDFVDLTRQLRQAACGPTNDRLTASGSAGLFPSRPPKIQVPRWPVISPLVREVALPNLPSSSTAIPAIVLDDSEEEQRDGGERSLPAETKRPAKSGKERAQACRSKKKARLGDQKALFGERDRLFAFLRPRVGKKKRNTKTPTWH